MKHKFKLYSMTLISSLLLLMNPLMGQTTEVKKKCGTNKTTTTTTITKSIAPQRVKINLPPNYKPPTADENLITFPETAAGKVKKKRLHKKRRKGKKQGCVAANM